MNDEVCIQLDADTLRMTNEENMTNLKPFDDEGFYNVDKALYGLRGSPRYWKDTVAETARDLGLKQSKIDHSLHMDLPTSFRSCMWTTNFSLETISLCVTWYETKVPRKGWLPE